MRFSRIFLTVALLAPWRHRPPPRHLVRAPNAPPTYTETLQVTATRILEDAGPGAGIDPGHHARRAPRPRCNRPEERPRADLGGGHRAGGRRRTGESSVPEFWGLKEFDAFLLVVDGVPWGGAFNPALSTLDLNDVERIEVQRGPAPVMYGATSFVGVIQVIRRTPGARVAA